MAIKHEWEEDLADSKWQQGLMTETRDLCASDGVPLVEIVNDVSQMVGDFANKVRVNEMGVEWDRPITDEEKAEREEYEKSQYDARREHGRYMVSRLKREYGDDPSQWPGM